MIDNESLLAQLRPMNRYLARTKNGYIEIIEISDDGAYTERARIKDTGKPQRITVILGDDVIEVSVNERP